MLCRFCPTGGSHASLSYSSAVNGNHCILYGAFTFHLIDSVNLSVDFGHILVKRKERNWLTEYGIE